MKRPEQQQRSRSRAARRGAGGRFLAAAVGFRRVAFWHRRANGKRSRAADPSLIIRERQTRDGVAMDHETMKVKPIFPLACVCLGLLARTACRPASRLRDLQDLAKLEAKVEAVSRKVMPATVALLSERTGSSGSGVITTADGLILTAAHVVQGAEELLVVFPDGKQVQGKVLGANYSKDIAMVKIPSKGQWPFVAMGASKSLEAGDWVIALGHSAGFDAATHAAGALRPRGFQRPGQFPHHRLHADRRRLGRAAVRPRWENHRHPFLHRPVSLTNNNHAGIDGFREDWDRILAGEAWGALSMNPFANPEMPVLGIGMAMMRGVKGVSSRAWSPDRPPPPPVSGPAT